VGEARVNGWGWGGPIRWVGDVVRISRCDMQQKVGTRLRVHGILKQWNF
jgi:hypothetical protein